MNFTHTERTASIQITIVASPYHVSSDMEGETIILNMKTGQYYGMNNVGSQIWHLLKEPRTVAELRDAVLNVYDIDPDRCETDLLALLQDLADEGLIEMYDEKDV